MEKMKKSFLTLMGWLLCAGCGYAALKLPSVLSDNMVLQQGKPVCIWGWADASEKISVSFDGDRYQTQTVADKDGGWRCEIGPLAAGGPCEMIISGEKDSITIKNVLIGEVWVCSGQSNMWWPMKWAAKPEQEIAQANYPDIRLFTVAQVSTKQPQRNCSGQWDACTPATAADFSAVAYYFGRELHSKLKVPVGLINTSWGGTAMEAWTKREALEQEPDFKTTLDFLDRSGKPGFLPGGLYNGMVTPLIPYGIQGVIWYQGESNSERSYQYHMLFPLMIRSWRQDWGQGDFPFYYAQLAPFKCVSCRRFYRPSEYAEVCDAQRLTMTVPNTGMIVTTDITDDLHDIHPKNKTDVGRRLALWAFAETYGFDDRVCSGPVFRSMKIENNCIRLFFDYIGSGLTAKDGELKNFQIAGEDRTFYPATAVIDGLTVVVSSEKVANPIAVRYGWTDLAWDDVVTPTLFNKEGLPASLFRTDDWPGTINCQ